MIEERPKIKVNQYGYHEVINKPNETELEEYYSKKYYQHEAGNYKNKYSESEITHMRLKFDEKHYVLENICRQSPGKFLDIGCGEGWNLRFFQDAGREVIGMDLSEHGIITQNIDLQGKVEIGNIYDLLKNDKYINFFNVILLDNLLEHVIDPPQLIKLCVKVLAKNGIIIVQVPNDFSVLQKDALDKGLIKEEFRICYPDHLSYFNKDGLVKLMNNYGLDSKLCMASNFIDFNLYNENTNYIQDKTKGKNCYESTKALDQLFHSISLEKTVNIYKALADLGLGRQIIGFFTPMNT